MKTPARANLLVLAAGLAAIAALFASLAWTAVYGVSGDAFAGSSVPFLSVFGAGAALLAGIAGWYNQRGVAARAAELEARGVEERSRDLEALAAFGQALGRATDREAVRLAAAQHLPRVAGSATVWVLVRDESDWTPLAGELPEPELAWAGAQANQMLNGTAPLPEHHGTVMLPMTAGGTLVGVLGVREDGPSPSMDRCRVLEAAASLLATSVRNADLMHEVRDYCARDTLTGCFTPSYAQQAIEAELRRAGRGHRALSLLVLDLDRFKAVNDRYGRACGDAVLATVGRRMRDVLRGSDLKCRWDEEEFLVLLPETGVHGARRVAETLRREIGERPFPWSTEALTVTASFGITQTLPGEVSLALPLGRARDALARAKEEGRNCVRLSSDALETEAGRRAPALSR